MDSNSFNILIVDDEKAYTKVLEKIISLDGYNIQTASSGEEALENRLSLELSRPLAHGVIKEGIERDEEAVRALFNHLIGLVKPKKNGLYFYIAFD